MIWLFWLSLLETSIFLLLFFWLPVMRASESFFAVRVSRDFYRAEGRLILRQYRTALITVWLLLVAIAVTLRQFNSLLVWVLPPLLMMLGGMLMHLYFHRRVKPFQMLTQPVRTVASLQARRLSDHTTVTLEAAVVVLTLAPALIVAHFYPMLPERIPVHWGFAMKPDRWAKRSISAVVLLPVVALWLQGLLLIAKNSFLKTRMPLPAQNTEAYLELKERGLRDAMQLLDAMRVILALLFGIITLCIPISSFAQTRHLEPVAAIFIWLCLPAVLCSGVYFTARTIRINHQLEELTGGKSPAAATSNECWYVGGSFYYNPNDPALFVEKQIGLGNTLNFAHQQALYIMAYILGGALLLLVWSFSTL